MFIWNTLSKICCLFFFFVATNFLLVSLKSLFSGLARASRWLPNFLSQETAGRPHCHGILLHWIAAVQYVPYFSSHWWRESTWIRTLKHVTEDFCAAGCAISSGDLPTRAFHRCVPFGCLWNFCHGEAPWGRHHTSTKRRTLSQSHTWDNTFFTCVKSSPFPSVNLICFLLLSPQAASSGRTPATSWRAPRRR